MRIFKGVRFKEINSFEPPLPDLPDEWGLKSKYVMWQLSGILGGLEGLGSG